MHELPGLRKSVYSVQPYIPGKTIEEVRTQYGLTDVIKLGSNENPYGPFPAALEAMQRELVTLNTYPDNSFLEIKKLIAARFGLDPGFVSISHGAGGMLETLAKTFLDDGDEAILSSATYGLYREITMLMGGRPVEVPLADGYRVDLDGMLAAVTGRTKLIWLCNPNNPTGTVVDRERFLRLLSGLPEHVWVVLDEAYAEFADPSLLPGFDRQTLGRNIIFVRTFSKAFGLAGARIGYAIARPEMIRVIDTVAEPFNANRVGIAGAMAALSGDGDAYRRAREAIIADRGRMRQALTGMGWETPPAHANFVFTRTPFDAAALSEALLRRGVIVRPCTGWGFPESLRISVGTAEETDRLLHALREAAASLDAAIPVRRQEEVING